MSRTNSFRQRLLALLLCFTFAALMPAVPRGDIKDKVVIHVGRPSVWSAGQAHYLLARLHERDQDIQLPLISGDALNPNTANATRVQIIKSLLDIEAQFNERIGVTNRMALREQQTALRRRDGAQTELLQREEERRQLSGDLRGLKRKLSPLRAAQVRDFGADATPGTDDDPPIVPAPTDEELRRRRAVFEKRAREIADLQAEIDAKTEEKTDLDAEIATLNTDSRAAVAPAALTDPELSTPSTPPQLPGLDTVKEFVERAIKDAPNPTVAASIALDNFIGMQNEIIAKQLTLLRDEVGRDERIVFLELPSSIYTVAGDADNYVAQVQWKVTGYQKWMNDRQDTPGNMTLNAINTEHDERANGHWDSVNADQVRAIDIIPRQSALNVNDVQATANRKNFLGVLKLVVGLGVSVNYQKQKELYENFLQQEIFASGYGKGLNTFGWTFGALPGSKRIAPGVRTTYAVLAVPRDAATLRIEATAAAFNRHDAPDYDLNSKTFNELNKDQFVARENFEVKLPTEAGTLFKVNSIYYTPAKKGDFATVIIKGENFSPQMGVQVEDAALKKVVSLDNNVNSKAIREGADGTNTRGWFEQVSTNELVMVFTMGDKEFTGTPDITLVSPERTSSLSFLELNINEHRPTQSLRDLSLTDPMFVDAFSLDKKNFKPKRVVTVRGDIPEHDQGYFEATLKGTGLRRRAQVWVNGVELKLCRDEHWQLIDEELAIYRGRLKAAQGGAIPSEADVEDSLKDDLAEPYATTVCQNRGGGCTADEKQELRNSYKRNQLRTDDDLYLLLKQRRVAGWLAANAGATPNEALRAIELSYEAVRGPADRCIIERTTREYTLRFPLGTNVDRLVVRYRQPNVRSFDADEFNVEKPPEAPFTIVSYRPDTLLRRATVDIRFASESDPNPRIVMPEDGRVRSLSQEDAGHWRAVFDVYFVRQGRELIERQSIPVTISVTANGAAADQALDIDLPVRPQVVRVINPRHGRPSGYVDEQPTVTLVGFNLQSVAKVFFGDAPGVILAPSDGSSLLVKVPKGGSVAKGEAMRVPVVLEKLDGTKVSSVAYYTYVGEPVPVVLLSPRRQRAAGGERAEPADDQEPGEDETHAPAARPPRL
jgi:hypothetical protein